VEGVTANQLIGPRVSGQAGGRKAAAEPSRERERRLAPQPAGYKSPSHRGAVITRDLYSGQ